jgi:hypothetical protein
MMGTYEKIITMTVTLSIDAESEMEASEWAVSARDEFDNDITEGLDTSYDIEIVDVDWAVVGDTDAIVYIPKGANVTSRCNCKGNCKGGEK